MRSIYIHIPFCRSRCYYCNFVSSCDYGKVDQYVDKLCENMVTDDTLIDSIFIGGGTPSTLSTVHFDKIFCSLHAHHNISSGAEITVECNPDSVTHELMTCLVNNGVNRISIGLQSVNDSTLSVIGRRHTYSQFINALSIVKSSGISNVNVDIMIGLPENHTQFINTVTTVASLDINHISMYALELYPNSVLASLVKNGKCDKIANDDMQAQWYDDAVDILKQHGFDRYEVSNFAKANCSCRHNVHYWQCHEYYGYGVAAHGYIADYRYSNTCDMHEFIKGNILAESTMLSTTDKMYEYIMLGLRLDGGVSISSFAKLFGIDIFQQYPNIAKFVSGGQLCIEGDMLYVSNNFTYVLTAILAEIL